MNKSLAAKKVCFSLTAESEFSCLHFLIKKSSICLLAGERCLLIRAVEKGMLPNKCLAGEKV